MLLGLAAASAGAAPSTDERGPFTFTQRHLGVEARIVVYAPSRQAADRAAAGAYARLTALDKVLGNGRGTELSRLSASAGGPPARVSADLLRVLRRAREVAGKSGGALIPAPLKGSATRDGRVSSAAQTPGTAELAGWRGLTIDPGARTVRLQRAAAPLNLHGIAGGYAADEAQRVLARQGISRALVQLGSDAVVSGPPPGLEGWTLRLAGQGPDGGQTRTRYAHLAVSTAGANGGSRAGAGAVPSGAQPPAPRYQATVTAPNGLTAAPLARVLAVLGPEARERLLAAFPGATAVVRPMPGSTTSHSQGEGWKVLFDGKSLGGWSPTGFAGAGDVRVESSFRGGPGAIVVDQGAALSGVNWTREVPKTNYEVSLQFLKIQGTDFACGLTFPVGDSFASLILGGWGGGVVGISSIDGHDASENNSTRYVGFAPDRWFRVRLRVTPDRLQAWLNDEQVVDQDIKGRRISLRGGDIRLATPLGLSTYQTSAAFRDIRLRVLVEGSGESTGAGS
ncbi:MAG TPA: FAD:protein FMN transferase [Armatimonadota bacterium]